MPWLFALLSALLFAAPALAAPRVVSINLCTDQLLVSLADPDQILGLSPFARDEARSWLAAEAGRFPVLSGTAEEVLVLRPDFVLAGRFTKRATREMLKAQGLRLVEFEAARSIEETRQQIRDLAALLGQTARGEAAVASIDAAVARAREAVRATGGVAPSVLPLHRRGWVSGGDTLTTSLLAAVGLRNAGAAFSRGSGEQTTLEAVIALKPDSLLVSSAGALAEDQGSALLEHPALRGLYPPEKRIVLPERLTICGGPMLAEALDRLAAEVARRP